MPAAPEPRSPGGTGSMSLLVDMATAALDPEYQDASGPATGRQARADARPTGPRCRLRSGPGGADRPAAARRAGHRHRRVPGPAGGQGDERGPRSRWWPRSAARPRPPTPWRRRRAGSAREVAAVRGTALGEDGQGQALAEAAGRARARRPARSRCAGPGLVVTLDDATAAQPTAGPVRAATGDGRIYDRDLQDVVNALWAAGAEEVAINGQRLTALTDHPLGGGGGPGRLPAAQPAVRRRGDRAPWTPWRPASSTAPVGPPLPDLDLALRHRASRSPRKQTLHLPAASPAELRLVRPGAPR